MHLGIPGFTPDWLAGLKAIKAAHGERLGRLVGRRLTSADLVCLVEDGSWFADCPVGLGFEGERVEICHQKFVGGTVDGTGLTHLGTREYDLSIGPFISANPLIDLTDP